MSNFPDKQDRGQMPPQGPNRYNRSIVGWIVIAGFAMILMVFLYKTAIDTHRTVSSTEFWNFVKNKGQLAPDSQLVVSDEDIEGEILKNFPGLAQGESSKFKVKLPSRDRGDNFGTTLQNALDASNSSVKVFYKPESWWGALATQLIVIGVLVLVVWFLLFRRLGAASGGAGFLGNFGRSRHRVSSKEQSRVTFNDVAGVDEAKDEVREMIEFLKNPKRFQRLGGRIPRGVLLVGEPGCGKTLLAKAIAGEADVPFFSISGSDFVEMFVGVGASRVRDLFKQAKDSSPCIIFLDEIDAVGRRRGLGFNGGGHDEREQTLNAILVEMDGFDSSDQVIVIAATNRSDVLDPALTRPGRFDRQINVPLPDVKGRVEIITIYLGKVKAGPDVDANRLARGTPMFSGADLAALVNEAAIAATMANKDVIEQSDLEEARDKVRWGRARKSRAIDEKEKEITAYHEAGHALVQMLTPGGDPLHKVSIIPRGNAGGATFSLPEKDRYIYTRSYCQALLRVLLGGRLAEKIFCNDVSSGASNDIAKATEIARMMVLDWGMSDKLGTVRYSTEEKRMIMPDMGGREYSDHTAEIVDQEVKRIIDEAHADSEKVLLENRDKLVRLAQALLRYETLTAEDVQRLIDGLTLDKPTVGDLLDREHAKTREGVTISPEPPRETPGIGTLPQPG